MITARRAVPAALVATVALALAGCGSTRMTQSMQTGATQPEQLQPLQQSTVAQTALPPIGANGQVTTAQGGYPAPLSSPMPTQPGQVNPALTGTPGQMTPALTGQPGSVQTLPNGTQTAAANGSFVTLDAVGSVPQTPGRDLTGGLDVNKLLGGWTIVSGATQCRLNLTQTAKTGTQRYRASTPGCQMQQLAAVSSWQLAGSQVQLFNEQGQMVAALILSGNRFIGTLAGGQGITMVG